MGGSLSPLGTTMCTFKLGEKELTYTFIICHHLLRPMIIGADFLRQKHIFIGYSELGKCVLEYKQLELVSSVVVDESPQLLLTKSVKVPQRSIVVLNTSSTVTEENVGQLYRVRINHLIHNGHPNLVLISAIHRIDEVVKTDIPLVPVNVGIQDI